MDDIESLVDNLIAADVEVNRAAQRAARRAEHEEAVPLHREDRERRTRDGEASVSAGVQFSIGALVSHDLIGDAKMRKLAREDGYVNIEWTRTRGKGAKAVHTVQNRWVLPASLHKIGVEAPKTVLPVQQGIYGNVPDLAAHERARSLPQKAPTGPRGRASATHKTSESRVTLEQRLREFPEQTLKIVHDKLRCAACKEGIPNIKSSISRHLNTDKHKSKMAAFIARNTEDAAAQEELTDYYSQHVEEKFGTIDKDTALFRMRCVECFMGTGTPLKRLDKFRSLLEREGHSLSDSSNMTNMFVPKIHKREIDLLMAEIKNELLSISFDGTTRLGEAINMTVRWCSGSFKIEQRLAMFVTTEKHCDHMKLASLICDRLTRQLGFPSDCVINMTRDSCATNGAACRIMRQLPLVNSADMMCIAHVLSGAGERIETPTLVEFTTPWLDLVGGRQPNAAAKRMWATMVAPQEDGAWL